MVLAREESREDLGTDGVLGAVEDSNNAVVDGDLHVYQAVK